MFNKPIAKFFGFFWIKGSTIFLVSLAVLEATIGGRGATLRTLTFFVTY